MVRRAFVLVETTFPPLRPFKLQKFIDGVLERRLAACANVVHFVASSYWWRGKIERADEALVSFKTTSDRADALVAYVRAHHPHEVPYIGVLPLEVPSAPYAAWLWKETRAVMRTGPERRPRSTRR